MTDRKITLREMVIVARYLLPIRELIEEISRNTDDFKSIREDITYDMFLEFTGGKTVLKREHFDLITRFIEALTIPGAAEHCLLLMDAVQDAENTLKAMNESNDCSAVLFP